MPAASRATGAAESRTGLKYRALKRKHVTLSIVWEEYIAREPDGYRYSRFCELYRGWEGRLSVTMRQSHAAGEKLFVDYAGDGVPVVVDRLSGELRNAQISLRCWAHRASLMRRRPGRKGLPIGSARMPALSRRSGECRSLWCPTTPRWR
jgi:transposase